MKQLAMEKFQVGKEYNYTLMSNSRPIYARIMGYGPYLRGQYFITILLPAMTENNQEDMSCSFMLSRLSEKDAIYTCVYNDFKQEEVKSVDNNGN